MSLGRETTIGLDVSDECLRLASFCGTSGRGRFQTLAYLELGPDTRPGEAGFQAELQRFLAQHLPSPKKTRIWALLRTAEVDVTTLRLPKMPKRRLSSAVFWQLQKEKKFDAAEFVLDYRVQGDVDDNGLTKHDIVACLAKRADVAVLSGWIESAGYAVAGITLLPAAFQSLYRLGWAPDSQEVVANIHVDVDFTCISIFAAGRLLFSRTIKFGVTSLSEDLYEQYNARSSDGELAMDGDDAAGSGFMDASDAAMVIDAFINEQPALASVVGHELDQDHVLELISHSLDRVSRQAERTLDYFAQNFNTRSSVLHLSGHVFSNDRVLNYLASQLGMTAQVFNPLLASGKKVQNNPCRTESECMRFNEAIALAVSSDSATLNLRHNYEERDQIAAKTMISNAIALAAMVLVVIGAGLFVWGNGVIEDRSTQLAAITSQLDGSLRIDQNTLQLAAGKATLRATMVRKVGERYRTLALLTEVSSLVPEGVRLLSVDLDFGPDPSLASKEEDSSASKDANKGAHKPERSVVFDGIVLGEERDQETLLTRLMANLESSLLLQDVSVESSEVQVFVPEGPVMHFVVQATLT